MNLLELTTDQLKRAAAIKEQIERLNRDLRAILGTPPTSRAAPKKTRGMSASARRKIAAAQRARWANLRRAKTATPSRTVASKKKSMSPAARRKLSAKLKAYWAAKKSGKE
jgi:hypothetical protein